MVLELELEHKVLLYIVLGGGSVHSVAQQRQARQRKVILAQATTFNRGRHTA